MNTFSHIRMGKLLYRYIKDTFDISLDKGSFVLGNLMPDFKPSYLSKSHYLENWELPLQEMIQDLIGTKQESGLLDKKYSFTLGVICHYYSDFFCFCHGHEYNGGTLLHMKYEWDLLMHSQNNCGVLDGVEIIPDNKTYSDASKIFQSFEKLHLEYQKLKPSFDNDIKYSLMACIEVIAMTAKSSIAEVIEEEEYTYPALQII